MRISGHFVGNMRIALMAITLAVSGVPAAAQMLTGRVIEQHSRLPLRGVQVIILADSARVVSSITTDTSGVFYADLPGAGAYRVHISVDSSTTFESAPITLRDSAYVEREFAISLEERIYTEDDVTRLPQFLSTSIPPKYPAEMLRAELDGNVVAEFVIDSTGIVRAGTFTVLKASDPRFGTAMRRSIESSRYRPAEKDGVPVAIRVRQRFNFGIDKMGFAPEIGARTAPVFPKPVIQ